MRSDAPDFLQDTASFQQRAGVIFLAMMMAAFASALEVSSGLRYKDDDRNRRERLQIMTLYDQRSIVEKHTRYAFIHPSAEAWASLISSLPYKIINALLTGLVYYFMANLNRQAGNFFFFLLLTFIATMTMSLFFRSVSALSRSMVQAMVPAGLLIVAMTTFSGEHMRSSKYVEARFQSRSLPIINRFRDSVQQHARMVEMDVSYQIICPDL